jgi:hypothetical protein
MIGRRQGGSIATDSFTAAGDAYHPNPGVVKSNHQPAELFRLVGNPDADEDRALMSNHQHLNSARLGGLANNAVIGCCMALSE